MTLEAKIWTVILRADGFVDMVEGAPSTWVGHALHDVPGVPAELVAAADALRALPPSPASLRIRSVHWAGGHAELVLLEALPLRRTLVNVSELLLRTLDVFLTQARNSEVDMQLDAGADLPAVLFVDGEKLAWALTTLVGNALRAFDDHEARERAAHITLLAAWNAERRVLELTVRDTGRGMPESRSRWLFEQDPSTGRSAGLALAMVRDVMVAHRGSVSVHSAVGVGTSITLHVPRLDAGSHA